MLDPSHTDNEISHAVILQRITINITKIKSIDKCTTTNALKYYFLLKLNSEIGLCNINDVG